MEYIIINDLKVYYYETFKEKENCVVFLHGWGASSRTFLPIKDLLDCHGIFIDLPGFGLSEIKTPLSIDDYVYIINQFLIEKNIKNPIILGHSFGGRIAIKYAVKYCIKGLYLVDSAVIKEKRGLRYYCKVYSYKCLKKVFKNIKMGSSDYKNATPVLKKTLIKAVNEDLKPLLKNISCKTVLIWGVNDKKTSYKSGKLMHKLIKKSVFYPILEASHFPFLEDSRSFVLYFHLGANYLLC